jgi:hypothetical protein
MSARTTNDWSRLLGRPSLDGSPVDIDDPVFGNVGVHVEVALYDAIMPVAARRQYLDSEQQRFHVGPFETLAGNGRCGWKDEDVGTRP